MNSFKKMLVLLTVFIYCKSSAQINCNTLDINRAPGKWVWQKGGYGTQWQYGEAIRKEMQRIMPVALDGLHATNSIAFGDIPAIPNTNTAPKYYEYYLMLKKFECLKGYNIVQPEGETGCWVYFVVNSIFQGGASFQDGLNFGYYANEGGMYPGDFYTQKDASGNRILYVSTFSKTNQKRGYFFSAKDRLPIRKISWKELIMSYYTFSDKEMTGKLTYIREGIIKNEKELTTTKYEDTKKYLNNLISDRKKEVLKLEEEKNILQNWYNSILSHKKMNELAYVNKSYLQKDGISELLNSSNVAGTYPVWIEDIDFFDLKKPKDQPQSIYFSLRRQDENLPKKNFMDLMFSQFNMDVLYRMVGEVPKRSNGINNIIVSLQEAKPETKANQDGVASYVYDFIKYPINQFPASWNGIKNSTVLQYENTNWLAFTKDGYCYPQQFNKEIKDNFILSFDLGWNKDISYNSGLFTVTLGEVEYDNSSEAYKLDGNQKMYMSLYDGYAGNFNRVICWFDPYWNGGGTLTVYSYNKNETLIFNKRITLPDFYLTKNKHKVVLSRKANSLIVDVDGRREAEWDAVFIPSTKYNLCTFSRYKGNNSDNKKDVFYLNNINLNY